MQHHRGTTHLELPRLHSARKVGLALGGGAVRGFAHIGALAVLQQEGIPIDFIAGTSIGSMVGAGYACGLDVHDMARTAVEFRLRDWIDLDWRGRMGLLGGGRFARWLDRHLAGKTFADADIPLAIVAADVNNGEQVLLRDGQLTTAVHASCAIPGVFAPVRHQGRTLVDGGVVNQVPADVVASMGADVVISVEVGSSPLREVSASPASLPWPLGHLAAAFPMRDVLEKVVDLMLDQNTIQHRCQDRPAIIIRPDVGLVRAYEFDKTGDCIKAGARAAEEALPAIRELLGAPDMAAIA